MGEWFHRYTRDVVRRRGQEIYGKKMDEIT
jgi:hypothetical protein